MFPKSIVFLSALALVGAATLDLGKREVFAEEDDLDNGPALLNLNYSEFWQYKKCCGICRDPDVQTYDLKGFRLNYPCMYKVTADLSEIVQVFMLTKPTGYNLRSFVERLDIMYNDRNYTFYKEDCKKSLLINPGGVYEPIVYENADVYVWKFPTPPDHPKWMIFRLKAVYFEVSWDCQSCLYICVAHGFNQKMQWLCGNNNNDPNDDPTNGVPYQSYDCPPNGGY